MANGPRKRDKPLLVYFSAAERALCERATGGMPLGTWLRSLALWEASKLSRKGSFGRTTPEEDALLEAAHKPKRGS